MAELRLWSSLSKATKAKYVKQGVTAQRYNAWQKMSKRRRTAAIKKYGGRGVWLQAGKPAQTAGGGAPAAVQGVGPKRTVGAPAATTVAAKLEILLRANGILRGVYDPATIRTSVDLMTDAEKAEAMRLDIAEYRGRASQPGWRYNSAPGVGKMWNPHWYRGGAPR